ncbi:sensor domain-containing phosphodiesterase [Salinisphaera hydrothermalis]|uniref:sensor domain-containing phosphodiesterase n=1 Tax=Salinisphaera hydrothermalis TaxID=563188 RepID=UPI00333EE985
MNAVTARYNGYQLHSVFQPILSLCHRRSVGFESLMRPVDADNHSHSPVDVIREAAEHGDIRQLDTLCQSLHIRNFSAQAPDERWLFLNLDPSTIADRWYHDGTLTSALREAGVPPQRLVIEIVEGAIDDEPQLFAAVDYFRSIGALVALDDFGTGHSNFDRIWRLAPDIIKLDRSLIVEAEQHRTGRLRQMLPNLVSLIHEAGSLVLAEGIETREQALLAMDADIDFVQGFYFAKPTREIDHTRIDGLPIFGEISQHFETTSTIQERLEADRIAPYSDAFRDAIERIAGGESPQEATRALMNMPRAARFYMLNARGEQLMHVDGRSLRTRRIFHAGPITDTSGGTWSRRQYFRAAMAEPQRLQTSRPYLSSTGAYMCVTLSIAQGNPPERVVCFDIDW